MVRDALFMGRTGIEWLRVPDGQPTVLMPRCDPVSVDDPTPICERRMKHAAFHRRMFLIPVFVEEGCAPTDEEVTQAIRGLLPESDGTAQFVPPRGRCGGTRAEHLEWCKGRAIEYVERGELDQAYASMMSDLSKHDETRRLAEGAMGGLGLMLLMDGALKSPAKMRSFIEGFR